MLQTTETQQSDLRPPLILPWYAIRVRTSGEAKVQHILAGKGYETFLPTYLESRRYSDRLKKTQAALFPGYLFCRFDQDKRLPILVTPGIQSIIGYGGTPQPIEAEIIEAVHRIVGAGTPAVPWPYMKAGDRVRVQYGALTGVEGIIVRGVDSDRLVLSIHLLQQSVALQIDREWVRPIGKD